MSILHHPILMTLHWTCMISMIGLCLDPTGVSATIGNYVGHIGDGLYNLFNAAAGNTATAATGLHAAHAGHTAVTATSAAAPVCLPPPEAATAAFSSAATVPATTAAAATLDPACLDYFNTFSGGTQMQIIEAAERAHMPLQKFLIDNWCGGLIPGR